MSILAEGLFYNHRCAYLGVLEKMTGHAVGHAHAAMRSCIAGQKSGVHADAVVESQEMWHGCVDCNFTRARFVYAEIGIIVDDFVSSAVFDNAVDRGFVIDVFFSDSKASGRGSVLVITG